MTPALSILALVGFVVVLLWLLTLPEDEEAEELAGLVAGNWHRFRD